MNRTATPKRGNRALAPLVERLTKPAFAARGMAQAALVADWPTVVGPRLAAHCLPERIAFPTGERSGATLHLRVESGPWAVEIAHQEPQIRERINGFFGYGAVARLRLIQGPLPRRRPAAAPPPLPLTPQENADLDARLTAVEDPEMRAILERFGRSVMGREKRRPKG